VSLLFTRGWEPVEGKLARIDTLDRGHDDVGRMAFTRLVCRQHRSAQQNAPSVSSVIIALLHKIEARDGEPLTGFDLAAHDEAGRVRKL
jgi:hypothetical protein